MLGCALAVPLSLGCARVPEQALRDEQARSRRYRDAYETEHDQVQALRARLAGLEKRQQCASAPAGEAAAAPGAR